jgi:hypothetical protein
LRNRRHSLTFASGLAGLLLITLSLLSCSQVQTSSSTAVPEPKTTTATAREVHVIFEGPWAIVADPKDPNSVLVLAPKTDLHRNLYVSANDEQALNAGTYELSVPHHGPATSAALDPGFAQVKIDTKNLQHALDAKSERYIIHLPKPEAYVAAKRFRARLGPTYPPDASTERNYAAYVSLRYTVASLEGFSVSGTPDSGIFNPMQLQLETPIIRFVIEPALAGPEDACHTHSRKSFRETAKFLGLTLYVDFPNDSPDCHKTDPQISQSTKAETREATSEEMVQTQNILNVQAADVSSTALPDTTSWVSKWGFRTVTANLLATVFFFHGGTSDCTSPVLFLTTTP